MIKSGSLSLWGHTRSFGSVQENTFASLCFFHSNISEAAEDYQNTFRIWGGGSLSKDFNNL